MVVKGKMAINDQFVGDVVGSLGRVRQKNESCP